MAILPLVVAPDPLLLQVSKPVEKVTPELQKFMDDMLETMYLEEGAGLAAVQVGRLLRILVIDITEDRHDEPNVHFFVNPEITYISEEKCVLKEGCLSFPGLRLEVERPEELKVKYLDYHGNQQEMHAKGWVARAIEHEMDHLNGVVFVNYAPPVKRMMMLKKAKKNKIAFLAEHNKK